MVLLNSTTGVTTYMLGVSGSDVTTIKQHGGSLTVGQLGEDSGTIIFDGSLRQAGQNDVVTMTTPVIPTGNTITTGPDQSNNFVINAVNYPTFVFVGMVALDSMIMNIAAPGLTSGTNTAFIDGSTLAGSLILNAQGDTTAKNTVTISKVSSRGTVTFQGGTSTSAVLFGTGRLADIQGNVDVHNAVLTIDNSAASGTSANSTAPGGSIMTMTSSTFNGWTIPGFAGTNPALTYTGIYGQLTVKAGEGDQFDLEATPAGAVTNSVFSNVTDQRDNLYFVTWSAATNAINGDFGMFLGQRLHPDGSVERVKHLTGIANVQFVMTFVPQLDTAGTNVVFDGDADAAGAAYTITGGPPPLSAGALDITNTTQHLDVVIENYRAQDQAYIYLPGGSVTADLTKTSQGIITIDGQARLSGTNSTAPNAISATVRAGLLTLNPTSTFNSVLQDFNTVNVLGSFPQDSFSVSQSTAVKIAPRAIGNVSTSFTAIDKAGVFDPVFIVNPPPLYYEVFATDFNVTTGRVGDILGPGWQGSYSNFIDEQDEILDVTSPADPTFHGHAMVREYPLNSNPQATDNTVNLDGSQMRGAFSFGAADPDYATNRNSNCCIE